MVVACLTAAAVNLPLPLPPQLRGCWFMRRHALPHLWPGGKLAVANEPTSPEEPVQGSG